MERAEWRGFSASGGKALGVVYDGRRRELCVDASIGHSSGERERLYRAIGEAKEELRALADDAARQVGKEESDIFFIHTLFLEDEDFLKIADRALSETHTAEYALLAARDFGISALLSTGDTLMIARCDDLRDVTLRVLKRLSGEEGARFPDREFLYFADDITPSEVLALSKTDCVGIVLTEGSLQSHAAILAGASSLPMLVKTGELGLGLGEEAYLDADGGMLVQPPREEERRAFRAYREEKKRRDTELLRYRELRFGYPSGRRLSLAVNISSLAECERAMANGAEGVGLFRSELLFMESEREPSEEEQFMLYRAIVEKSAPYTAVLRVLDIGADKIPTWLTVDHEPNPALGLRGVRLIGRYPALFETQLRAMLRAAAYGNAVILLPMVTSPDEVIGFRALLHRLSAALVGEGRTVGGYRLGVMIETPAAALDCRALSEVAEYFSIGSNDLFQYTMAIDRENPQALALVDSRPRALFRLLDEVIAASHEKGVTVSLCGALAADPEVAAWLLAREIDVLSLPLSSLLPTKELCAKNLKTL